MDIQRIIGSYSSGIEGPLLFVTAGIHGNEPSGVIALQHIFSELHKSLPSIQGTFVGVSGNQLGLSKGIRFIDQDLNRTWTKTNLLSKSNTAHELTEMRAILEVLKSYMEGGSKKCYFLDCHTTSSPSAPYISVQDINDNCSWAKHFPTSVVIGFSDIITGDIDHYLSSIGLTGFVFEAGQHTSKSAVVNQQGMIWLVLKEACGLNFDDLSEYPNSVITLKEQHQSTQKSFKILYRHELKENDTFEMEPGFENFSKTEKGQLLAIENGEEIRSKWDAYIFMPLYQSLGDDGFFIIDTVDTWSKASN